MTNVRAMSAKHADSRSCGARSTITTSFAPIGPEPGPCPVAVCGPRATVNVLSDAFWLSAAARTASATRSHVSGAPSGVQDSVANLSLM